MLAARHSVTAKVATTLGSIGNTVTIGPPGYAAGAASTLGAMVSTAMARENGLRAGSAFTAYGQKLTVAAVRADAVLRVRSAGGRRYTRTAPRPRRPPPLVFSCRTPCRGHTRRRWM